MLPHGTIGSLYKSVHLSLAVAIFQQLVSLRWRGVIAEVVISVASQNSSINGMM